MVIEPFKINFENLKSPFQIQEVLWKTATDRFSADLLRNSISTPTTENFFNYVVGLQPVASLKMSPPLTFFWKLAKFSRTIIAKNYSGWQSESPFHKIIKPDINFDSAFWSDGSKLELSFHKANLTGDTTWVDDLNLQFRIWNNVP